MKMKMTFCDANSEAREWRHHSDRTQTNKLEWWMILKIFLRAKAGVPKTHLKRKHHLHSLYFPQNTLMLTESRGEFNDLHSMCASLFIKSINLISLHFWHKCLLSNLALCHVPNEVVWRRQGTSQSLSYVSDTMLDCDEIKCKLYISL